jgi:hypothetical protein
LAALREAGFTVEMVPGSPGMICQIDAVPDPCNGAPVDAYWSYWLFDAGQWVYSNLGAASRTPAPGDVEAWAFGAGDPPSITPETLSENRRSPTAHAGSPSSAWTVLAGPLASGVVVALLAGLGIYSLLRRRRRGA